MHPTPPLSPTVPSQGHATPGMQPMLVAQSPSMGNSGLVLMPYPMAYQQPQATQPAPAVAPAAPAGTVISLEDIVACLTKHWKVALTTAAITAGLLTFFLIGRVPQYESESTLLMRAKDNKIFSFEKVVDNDGEANSSPTLLNNHKAQLKTRMFWEYLYTQLDADLIKAYTAPPGEVPLASRLIGKVTGLLPKSAETRTPEEIQRDTFFARMDKVGVDFVKESHLLKASVVHHDPEVAAKVANEYVRLYEHFTAHEDNAAVKEAVAFQRKQAEALRQKVQQEEEALAAYLKAKGIVSTDSLSGSGGEKLKLLGSEIARVEVDLSKAEEVLRSVGDARGETTRLLSIEMLANHAAVSGIRSAWVEKQREKESVDQIYLAKHPKYIDFYNQYNATESELKKGLGIAIADLQNRVENLRNQNSSLKKRVSETESAVLGIGQDTVKRNELQRQLDADRDTLTKLLSRLNETNVSSDFNRTTNLRVADIAVPADKPKSPDKFLAIVLGGLTFGGVFLTLPIALTLLGLVRTHGVVGAIRLAQGPKPSATAPQPSAEATPQLSLPGLPMPGTSIMMGPNGPVAYAAMPSAPAVSTPVEVLGHIPLLPAGQRSHEGLVAAFQQQAPTAQAFLELAKMLSERKAASHRTIVITSVQPEEGKSHLAAGLAAAAVMEGQRTLLIDCHLYQPGQPNWLPQASELAGLEQLLHGQDTVLDLNSLRYGRSDLFVLQTGGAKPGNDIFRSKGFSELLDTFARQVDLVLLDAPCLQDTAEITAILPHADRVLLAWNPTLTSKELLQWGGDLVRSTSNRLSVASVECR